jgi:hypothetical protein
MNFTMAMFPSPFALHDLRDAVVVLRGRQSVTG